MKFVPVILASAIALSCASISRSSDRAPRSLADTAFLFGSRTAGSLSPDLDKFYQRVLGCSSEPDRARFGALATAYARSHYSFEEFSGAMASLRHVVVSRNLDLAKLERREADEIEFPEPRADGLVVWVDPTCSVCARVAETIVAVQRDQSASAPSAIYRLLPGNNAASMHAAVALRMVRAVERELYASLVLEFLATLPDDEDSIDAHFKNLEGFSMHPRSDPGYAAAGIALPREWGPYHRGDAPVVVFRGRRLLRDRTVKPGFNALADALNLNVTIESIRAYDRCPQ